ncbi:hypothetical protein GGX14DRAFT_389301 [Mycena pura]|uniref:Uncharacterized protein n=1 Tax=Mycena pura TaxID=153505 RepID=A0AAD6YHX3_9AGAR|nr:hypothetical protein GGX14DRAFT_389301 [Mycena pura]
MLEQIPEALAGRGSEREHTEIELIFALLTTYLEYSVVVLLHDSARAGSLPAELCLRRLQQMRALVTRRGNDVSELSSIEDITSTGFTYDFQLRCAIRGVEHKNEPYLPARGLVCITSMCSDQETDHMCHYRAPTCTPFCRRLTSGWADLDPDPDGVLEESRDGTATQAFNVAPPAPLAGRWVKRCRASVCGAGRAYERSVAT